MANMQHQTKETITPVLERILALAPTELNQFGPLFREKQIFSAFTSHDENYRVFLVKEYGAFGFRCGESYERMNQEPLNAKQAAKRIAGDLQGTWDVLNLYENFVNIVARYHSEKTEQEVKERLGIYKIG